MYTADMSIKCDFSSYDFTIFLFSLASYVLVRKKNKNYRLAIYSDNHIVFIQIICQLYFCIPRAA